MPAKRWAITHKLHHFAPAAVREAQRLLASGDLDVSPLLSGSLPLLDLAEALGRVGRGEGIKYELIP